MKTETNESRLTIECPKCHRTDTAELATLITAGRDEEEYRKLLDGSYFRHDCPYCGCPTHITQDLLFVDPEHRGLAFLVHDPQDAERLWPEADQARRQPQFAGYAIRIVRDDEALAEKAFIWSLGLDDRAAELLKLTYLYHIAASQADFRADRAVLAKDGAGARIDFYWESEYVSSAAADLSLAAGLKERFMKSLQADDAYIVDLDWAREQISGQLHRRDD